MSYACATSQNLKTEQKLHRKQTHFAPFAPFAMLVSLVESLTRGTLDPWMISRCAMARTSTWSGSKFPNAQSSDSDRSLYKTTSESVFWQQNHCSCLARYEGWLLSSSTASLQRNYCLRLQELEACCNTVTAVERTKSPGVAGVTAGLPFPEGITSQG